MDRSQILVIDYAYSVGQRLPVTAQLRRFLNDVALMLHEFDAGNSYRVTLNDKEKTQWSMDGTNGTEIYDKEPGASVWRKMLARIISWIPIENQL